MLSSNKNTNTNIIIKMHVLVIIKSIVIGEKHFIRNYIFCAQKKFVIIIRIGES